MVPTKKTVSCSLCIGLTVISNLVVYQISWTLLVGQHDIFDRVPRPTNQPWQVANEEQSQKYHISYNHSFGFFDNIPNWKWKRDYQQPVLEDLAVASQSNDTQLADVSRWLDENMDPVFVCPHQRKVGNPAGKWMCDPERWVRLFERRKQAFPETGELPCLVYSIGSKGNFRWEEEFMGIIGEKWCEVHIIDPSPVHESAEELKMHPHWHYHAWGMRGTQSTKNYTRRRDFFHDFSTMRNKLGHQNRSIDIFKIDCEGCEWESMPDWLFSDAYPASFEFPDLHHVLLETHSLPLPSGVRAAGNFGRLLPMPEVAYLEKAFAKRGFVVYAKEVNTHRGLGVSVEWGLVRLSSDFFVGLDW